MPHHRRSFIATTKTLSPRRRIQLHRPNGSTDIQLASALAGVASRVLLHPIDCIKTRLQHLRGRPGSVDSTATMLRFIAREGIPGLYRGIFGALIGVIPYSLLYMPSYEFAQAQMGRTLGQKELMGMRHVVAGSVAGLCGSLVKVPMDVVKKRLQAGLYPNFIVAVTSISREGSKYGFLSGPAQFYSGWRSSVFYDIPYNAVQFTVLEYVKQVMCKFRRKKQLSKMDNVLVGAFTGMITSLVTEPLDVVKTRMMTQRLRAAPRGETVYRGWLHCVNTMIKEEGVPALWKGTLPRLLWVGASSAIWYGTYQAARQILSEREQKALKGT